MHPAAIIFYMLFVIALPFAMIWLHKKMWWNTAEKTRDVMTEKRHLPDAKLKKSLRWSGFMLVLWVFTDMLALICLLDWDSQWIAYLIQVICYSICAYCEIQHYRYIRGTIRKQKLESALP